MSIGHAIDDKHTAMKVRSTFFLSPTVGLVQKPISWLLDRLQHLKAEKWKGKLSTSAIMSSCRGFHVGSWTCNDIAYVYLHLLPAYRKTGITSDLV